MADRRPHSVPIQWRQSHMTEGAPEGAPEEAPEGAPEEAPEGAPEEARAAGSRAAGPAEVAITML
ncbi:hypothetical protein PR001_g13485 [Phytophthora rubi]|uniref:Uncharacterized protein n=2 Tax=Phytophthora rubi TaxID=129364 RepID=A0A6A3LYA3_9STRA|nr:hypothetical protein PR001_g13485 [Phytophthora rubi]